jgi:hypothetical protein
VKPFLGTCDYCAAPATNMVTAAAWRPGLFNQLVARLFAQRKRACGDHFGNLAADTDTWARNDGEGSL